MRIRSLSVTLTLLCAIACVGPVTRAAWAQAAGDEASARAPRFLLAMATTRRPLDVQQMPVLNRRIALDLDGVSLRDALATITRESGLKLAYNDDEMPAHVRVHLRASEISVAGALSTVLLGVGVDVVFTPDGHANLAKRVAVAPVAAPGAIVGRVTDAKTQTALAGATVVVQGTSHSATTGSDGRYRIAAVAPRTYTVRARYIGYTPGTISVTVSADREATADVALEKSIQRLDEVVTTGTVVPTEVKALPTPISVITGDEIAQKGYQRVDQIFRGDIPGAIAWDRGAPNYTSSISIRGTTRVGGDYVKTYIDGVEVANHFYLGTIDPASIERIEIVRGPEASTIYGSDASGGVMRIFTKKGAYNTPRAQVEAKVSAGLIQSQWDNTAQTDNSLAVRGGSSDFSYQLGGGLMHSGDWVPDAHTTNTSFYGGLRGAQGLLTVELSGRYYDKSFGDPLNPSLSSLGGYYAVPLGQSDVMRQQTYGLTVNYRATPHWQHNLVFGYDRSGYDYSLNRPRFITPSDSFVYVSTLDNTKASVAYNTTYDLSLGRAARVGLTAGADHWVYHAGGFDAFSATQTTNIVPSPDEGYRFQYANTGYFAQGQLGLWDAVFVTAGLRAEDNQNFGQDFGLAWAPRAGLSLVHTWGGVTAKTRVAFGKAIRPPGAGLAEASQTPYSRQLSNPKLGPEQQKGWDGGIEFYFARRASLEVSYYDQTAIDLIDNVTVSHSPLLTTQNQNVGRIKNSGWEFQGRLNAGQLSLTGTFSITKSVVQQLSPTYTGDLQPGDQMLHIPNHSAGATLAYNLPHTEISVGMTHIGSWIETDWVALLGYFTGAAPYRGSGRAYWITYPSFTKFNLSVSQSLTGRLSVFIHSENLTNNNVAELRNININSGRATLIGVRTRL